MRRILHNAAVTLALCACGGDGDPSTGPSAPDITGTFIGDYTVSLEPGVLYEAELELNHSVDEVFGTLTVTSGRSADFSGSVSGTQVTGTFTFTDNCPGTASATANITNNGTRLTGDYIADDCIGSYTGRLILDKHGSSLVTATGPSPSDLTANSGWLFWSEAGENPIRAISLAGGSPVVLAQRIGVPKGVAVWGQDVFWLDEQSGTSAHCTPGTKRILKKTSASGGMATVLATGDVCRDVTSDLVVDGTHVYWVTTNGSPNTYVIRRTPVSGGISTIVTTSQFPIVAMIGHSGNLYWMENFFPDPVGAIRMVPTSGGSPVTVASGITSRARTFAVNSTAVFYAEANFPSTDELT